MEFETQLTIYMPIIVILINILVGWMVWSFRKATVSRDDFNQFTGNITAAINALDTDVRDELSSHDKRISVVESELKHLPNHSDLKNINQRLDGVSESLSTLVGTTKATSHQVNILNEYLLNKEA